MAARLRPARQRGDGETWRSRGGQMRGADDEEDEACLGRQLSHDVTNSDLTVAPLPTRTPP